jgi:hypothetical protein
MSHRVFAAKCRFYSVLAFAVACAIVAMSPASSHGQVIQSAVGGVSIDAEGLVNAATIDNMNKLGDLRREDLEKIPGDLNGATEMRKISLRRLEEAIEDCTKNNKPLPDAVKYLAGLQHIRYVFVYPEQKDIVLVGPGEGWKVDGRGNVVGVTTGRPVMLLDDLLVAMRTAKDAAQGGITCSIDPTQEGLARLSQLKLRPGTDSATMAEEYEKAMGIQQIRLHGVPDTSHFARVLVAADYRMKRIAMALDSSPVRGLPSYLQIAKPSKKMISPRFWLEPKFDGLLADANGLAFELCGSSVKAMTEDDYIAANGGVQHSGKAGPMAQKWADTMTEKYAELAVADPVFGQLQNCMELAVAGAIVVKDNLPEKAGYDLPVLLGSSAVKPDVYNAPKQAPTLASILKKGRGLIAGVSGGVAINSWAFADKAKTSDKVAAVRTKAAFEKTSGWWQN